jgi:general secretion pathway protein C
MKRWPLVASFLLFLLLCASVAYWGLQLFKPPLRPVAAPPRTASADVPPEAAAALFGGKAGPVAVASNYQLHGVILSGTARDSVAILSADGKPAQALRVNAELAPGVVVKEVHRDHVLLSDGGVVKRVELPETAQLNVATASPVPSRPALPAAPPPPATPATPTAPGTSQRVPPGATGPSSQQGPTPASVPTPAPAVVVNPTPTPPPATPTPAPSPTPAQQAVPAPAQTPVRPAVPAPVLIPGTPPTGNTTLPSGSVPPGEMREAPLRSR